MSCSPSNAGRMSTRGAGFHPGELGDYSIPYGLLYSKDAPEDVLKFVDVVEKMELTLSLIHI